MPTTITHFASQVSQYKKAQEDHRAKNPHPMLPVFCQVYMSKKVTQEMFMYKLVFNKDISKFFPIYLYVKQEYNLNYLGRGQLDNASHQISKL